MSSFSLPFLAADAFDRFRLFLPDGIVNWLTPIWILSVGALAGLILTSLLWGVLKILSLIPGIGTLSEEPLSRRIAIGLLTFLLFVGVLAAFPSVRQLSPPPQAADAAGPVENMPQAPSASSRIDRLWAVGGVLVGCWLLAVAVVTLVSRRALAETGIAIREGVLWPLFVTALVMSAFAVLGLFIVREPTEFLGSLLRWPKIAAQPNEVYTFELPGVPSDATEVPQHDLDVRFLKAEAQSITVESDQRVKVRTAPFMDLTLTNVTLEARPGEAPARWRKQGFGANPFREEVVTKLYAQNLGDQTARVTVTVVRALAYPQMALVPVTAVSMAALFFIYLLQRAATPKLAAVALSTSKSEIAQPLYAITMALGIFLIVIFVFVPYFTLGSDIKMLKDSGLSLILVLCIIQAVWAASSSVADEVEGKTALTVLSKPVSRRAFLVGKFAGIAWSVGLMCVMLGLLLLIVVAYKPIYDSREGTYTMPDKLQTDPTWQNCYYEMVQIVPGLVLVYLETLVMAALSVAISTRLPALANFLISFSIYVLGHLTPLLVQSQVVAKQLPPVVFFGRLIATVIPVLDHFNVQASVAAGVNVPLDYLAWALVYCALYSTVAMLLALVLFEDRDLA
jgi:ABC-type transport system involved in multi-copper enzyme maturation permease subunit